MKKANQATHHELLESNGGLAAGMDDTYLMGHPDATVPAVSNHKTCLQEVGLKLNEDKTFCYIVERYRNSSYWCMLGEMSEGMLHTDEDSLSMASKSMVCLLGTKPKSESSSG
eukprot:12008404-Ditylum_brightwellii.AAC.1